MNINELLATPARFKDLLERASMAHKTRDFSALFDLERAFRDFDTTPQQTRIQLSELFRDEDLLKALKNALQPKTYEGTRKIAFIILETLDLRKILHDDPDFLTFLSKDLESRYLSAEEKFQRGIKVLGRLGEDIPLYPKLLHILLDGLEHEGSRIERDEDGFIEPLPPLGSFIFVENMVTSSIALAPVLKERLKIRGKEEGVYKHLESLGERIIDAPELLALALGGLLSTNLRINATSFAILKKIALAAQTSPEMREKMEASPLIPAMIAAFYVKNPFDRSNILELLKSMGGVILNRPEILELLKFGLINTETEKITRRKVSTRELNQIVTLLAACGERLQDNPELVGNLITCFLNSATAEIKAHLGRALLHVIGTDLSRPEPSAAFLSREIKAATTASDLDLGAIALPSGASLSRTHRPSIFSNKDVRYALFLGKLASVRTAGQPLLSALTEAIKLVEPDLAIRESLSPADKIKTLRGKIIIHLKELLADYNVSNNSLGVMNLFSTFNQRVGPPVGSLLNEVIHLPSKGCFSSEAKPGKGDFLELLKLITAFRKKEDDAITALGREHPAVTSMMLGPYGMYTHGY